jgi:hypothetical protein
MMDLDLIDLSKVDIEIIDALASYKILPTKTLVNLLDNRYYRQILEFNLGKLRKHGYVNSVIDKSSHKTKYYFLTGLGVKKTGKEYLRPLDESQFFHELYLSRILLWLRSFSNISIDDKVEVTFEKGILPDAAFSAFKNQKELKFAIEVELTQKEKSRYESKVLDYHASNFAGVFYFCKTRTILNAVSGVVDSVSKQKNENSIIRSKFVFIELPDKFSKTKFEDFNYLRDTKPGVLSDLLRGLV